MALIGKTSLFSNKNYFPFLRFMLVGSPVAKCLWHNGFVIYTRGAAKSGWSVERKL